MEIEVVSPIEVEAEIQRYTLVSDDIYVRRYDASTIPPWYATMIDNILQTTPTITSLESVIDLMQNVQDGFNMSIVNLQSADTTINTSLTTLQSSNDILAANVLDLDITKITATDAQAISLSTVAAYFADGSAGSWFTNQISTYSSEVATNATAITTLGAVLDGQQVTISSLDAVVISQGTSITNLQTTVSNLETDVGVSIADLQNQIDGVVDTYFKNYAPTMLNFPAGLWMAQDTGTTAALCSISTDSGTELVTNALVYHNAADQMYQYIGANSLNVNLTLENYADTLRWTPINHTKVTTSRTNHTGDLFYDVVSGFSYRFLYSDIEDTPDMGVIFSWVKITDSDVTLALANAATAQHTADGKASIYYSATTPVPKVENSVTIPIEIGDLWVNSTTNVTKVAVAVTPSIIWGDITNTSTQNALLAISDLEEARDGSVVVFYLTSTASATGMTYGDYLVDTDSWDGTKYIVYRYQNNTGGSSGTLAWYTNLGDTATALSSGYRAQVLAGTAQSTADGKVKTWYQPNPPTGLSTSDIGDIWVDTDNNNALTTWSGTAWVDTSNTNANQALTWSASSAKYITAPDGSITGFEMSDGSESVSSFTIRADLFKLVASSQTAASQTPFTVNALTGDIAFNGSVSFSNITETPSNAILYDDFEYVNNTALQDKWKKVNGAGTFYAINTSTKSSGAQSMYAGATTSPDIWLEHQDFYSFDPTKLYKLSCKTRHYLSDGTCYIGLVCYAADKTTKLNVLGLDNYGSSHYIAASAETLITSFVEYDGYFQGTATTGVGSSVNTLSTPAKLYSGTAFVRPIVIANFGGTTGYMYFDELKIEEVINPAALINANTTTINGGQITTNSILANRIQTYNLTAANATLENAIIKTAMIGDAQITNAKINNLAVTTLKIGNYAVTVPVGSTGSFSVPAYTYVGIQIASINVDLSSGIGSNIFFLMAYNASLPPTGGISVYYTDQNHATKTTWFSGTGEPVVRVGWFTGNTTFYVHMANPSSQVMTGTFNLFALGTKK